ncbi:DNA translocase FtsK [Anaeromicrobium sediminis]|uniref:Cell division protein FtsK n=1 Tax=Anaeromicrobium sediminis TaxID=1478221 RepID=A0A267MNM7_9FIRM|nr:DNA translocase FtsK [Anaeromicrobium sediminis]PAB61211.1 cell division protein FtsK [Anaeromicrobium sediminis]
MAKKRRTAKKENTEFKSILIVFIGIFIYISLTYNSVGQIGNLIKVNLMGLFSTTSYVLPVVIISFGILSLFKKKEFLNHKVKYSVVIMYICYLILFTLYSREHIPEKFFDISNIKNMYIQGTNGIGGGLIGNFIGYNSIKLLGVNGSYFLVISVIILSLISLLNLSLIEIFEFLKEILEEGAIVLKNVIVSFVMVTDKPKKKREKKVRESKIREPKVEGIIEEKSMNEKIKILDFTKEFEEEKPIETNISKETNKIKETNMGKETKAPVKNEEIEIKIDTDKNEEKEYIIPPIDLLEKKLTKNNQNDKKEILGKASILEQTLDNFGVEAKVVQVSKGPSITRYEIQPSPGVKVSKIVNLSDDIALNLAASNIRIEAPIPGKAAVGIEVPNDEVSMVTIREVIESEQFLSSPSKVSFVLGKDIAGNTIVTDLSKMPHMLIAGATGSGKSVCVNAIINSILYKAKPNEVKVLLIDPKVVELSTYNGIPHLLIPVVTDPNKASSALNWAVSEMTRRYKSFAENNVRDIGGYNKKMKELEGETFPQIVIIIDELADLMMVSPSQVEDSICRLAQMARAAGIHLIVATQRPSVDVITGVIKANIPSRIAFSVSSQADSRTILDMGGAEKLLGKGDMLFYPVGSAKPIRVQGAFISDSEVEKVVGFVKNQSEENNYEEDIIDNFEQASMELNKEVDPVLKEAIDLVVNSGQASISMLQRRFRIGYNRAARLIDELEERNIVGPHEGSKPRKVLMTKEELETIQAEEGI